MIVILVLFVVLLAYIACSILVRTSTKPVRESGTESGVLVGTRNNSEVDEREHRPFAPSAVRIHTGRFGEDPCTADGRTSLR